MRSPCCLQLLFATVFVLLSHASSVCAASIEASSPVFQLVTAPPSVLDGDLKSDTTIYVFAERQNLTLQSSLPIDIGAPGTYSPVDTQAQPGQTLPAGLSVNSFFIHLEAISSTSASPLTFEGSITFGRPILGVEVRRATLNDSKDILGLPTVSYETNPQKGFGLEILSGSEGSAGADRLTLGADSKTIAIRWNNTFHPDQIRVITSVPEPSSFALAILGGLGALIFGIRRSRVGAASSGMTMKCRTKVLMLCIGLCSPLDAGELLINGSFEMGPAISSSTGYLVLGDGDTRIPGWRVKAIEPGGTIDIVTTYWQQTDGLRSIDLNGSPGPGRIEQTVPTVPGASYRLAFSLAGNPTFARDPIKTLAVSANDDSAQFDVNNAGFSRSNMGWKDYEWEFKADAATTVVAFQMIYPVRGNEGIGIDNVRLTPIPEPETYLLLLFGALALMPYALRRRRTQCGQLAL